MHHPRARRERASRWLFAMLAFTLAGCHSPGAYTSARPVATGAVFTGMALEPIVFLRNRTMTDVGPSATVLVRIGAHERVDVGLRFNGSTVGGDVKVAPYLGDRLAIAVLPGVRAGHGYWIHAPVLVSYDVTSWFRLIGTGGVAWSSKAYDSAGSTTMIAFEPIPVDTGAQPDGWHGRLGAGFELHSSRGFGVIPEITWLQATDRKAFSSVFLGLGITWGRVGYR